MMNIVYKRVDEIIPYEKNPRINDAAVDAVAQSIKEFGFRVPIVLDKNNVIITGHTRLRSAKSIGLTEVPCIIADWSNRSSVHYRGQPHAGTGAGIPNRGQQDRRDRGVELRPAADRTARFAGKGF